MVGDTEGELEVGLSVGESDGAGVGAFVGCSVGVCDVGPLVTSSPVLSTSRTKKDDAVAFTTWSASNQKAHHTTHSVPSTVMGESPNTTNSHIERHGMTKLDPVQ